MSYGVRIVKTSHCPKCNNFIAELDKHQFPYTVFDADNPDNIPQLDKWAIVEFPVVQIVDSDGNMVWQFQPGRWSLRAIRFKISEIEKNETK